MSAIRWSSSPRPDTGVTNATLGLWLFLAAEVMFFGSLLSSLVLLRLGNGELWAAEGFAPGVLSSVWKAAVLVASSLTLHLAVRRMSDGRRAVLPLVSTVLLGGVFVGARVGELVALAAVGLLPRSGVATAMFYTVSGLHLGQLLVVLVLLVAFSFGRRARDLGDGARRLRFIAAVWHFFVAVWLVFTTLFLLS